MSGTEADGHRRGGETGRKSQVPTNPELATTPQNSPPQQPNRSQWAGSPRVIPESAKDHPGLPANDVTVRGVTRHHQGVDQRENLLPATREGVAEFSDEQTGPIPTVPAPPATHQSVTNAGDMPAVELTSPRTDPIPLSGILAAQPLTPAQYDVPGVRKGSWDSRWPIDGADPASIPEAEKKFKTPKPWWRKAINVAILLAVIAISLIVLQGKLPSLSSIGSALSSAIWWWILAAGAATVASVSLFADQQRQLLIAFDTRITRRRATAITYASTAITNSVPAGAAVSAGFSFKQYRAAGATRSTAATVMVLSGLISAITLVLMYFLVLSLSAATPFITLIAQNTTIAIVVGVLLAGLAALILRRVINGPKENTDEIPTPRLDRFERRWPRIAGVARDGLETLRQAQNVRVRDWVWAITATMGKWTLEGICLLTCALAFGIRIDLLQLGVLYLSVQLVRQIPLTPGGIGPVETALLVGLVATGAGHGAAAAAVLIYRVLSAWLIIPVGFALLAEMKRRDARNGVIVS